MVRLFEIFDAIPISSWVREARWYRFPGFCLNGRELSFVRAGHRFIDCSDSDRLVVSGGIMHADLPVAVERSGAAGGRAVVIATIDSLMGMESLRNHPIRGRNRCGRGHREAKASSSSNRSIRGAAPQREECSGMLFNQRTNGELLHEVEIAVSATNASSTGVSV